MGVAKEQQQHLEKHTRRGQSGVSNDLTCSVGIQLCIEMPEWEIIYSELRITRASHWTKLFNTNWEVVNQHYARHNELDSFMLT